MRSIAMVAALVIAVLAASTALHHVEAHAQGDAIELRLTKQIEGLDPQPEGTDFSFDAPALGGEFTLKPGASIYIEASGDIEFTFTELNEPGWEFVSATCDNTDDFTVVPTDTGRVMTGVAQQRSLNCTFTSRALEADPGTLTITKRVDGTDPIAGGTPFDFTNTADAVPRTLRDGESFSLSFQPPRVTVTEVGQIGWSITSFECDGAFDIVSSAQLQAHTIIAGPGSNVACTFVNEQSVAADVTVIKEVVGANPTDQSFAFTVNDTLTDFELADGQSLVVSLNPGSYTFRETPVAGWQMPQITCGDQETVTADEITLTLTGGPIECTFVNRPDATDLLGDVNCDGVLNILDAFQTSEFVVNLRTAANGCPLASQGSEINIDAVSIGGAAVTIQDAFRVSQCVVGLPNVLCPDPAG